MIDRFVEKVIATLSVDVTACLWRTLHSRDDSQYGEGSRVVQYCVHSRANKNVVVYSFVHNNKAK